MRTVQILATITLVIAVLTGGLFADSETEIRTVIEKSYFNGAFNGLDTEAMKKGFHPDFAIFSPKGTEINKYPIAKWIEGTNKWKKSPKFDKSRAQMDCKIVKLDVTGVCASAKIELSKKGKLIYTDYLSLLKFKDGWKIVAKVYHRHPKK